MFQILNVNESNYKDSFNFLKSVPSISNVEDSILKNGVIVVDDDKVIGSIAFESYDHIGLVRYFVFKKSLSLAILNDLLVQLELNAKKMGINELICVADNYQIEDLFKELDFQKLNKKIFINEEMISKTSFSNFTSLFKTL